MLVTWPDPRMLATVRIVLGVATILNALEVSAILGRVADGALGMPGILDVPVTTTLVSAWMSVTVLTGALVLLGVVTRAAALAASTASIAAMLWDRQVYANHIWLCSILLVLLASCRSDAVWSLESAVGRRHRVGSTVPVVLMLTQLSICYLFGALSKLNPWWLAGDELRWSLRVTLPSSFYPPLAVAVVATELFIAVGMWFRPTRLPALGVGVGLHAGIVVLMHERLPLMAFGLVCLSLYPLVATVPPLRDVLARGTSPASVGDHDLTVGPTRPPSAGAPQRRPRSRRPRPRG